MRISTGMRRKMKSDFKENITSANRRANLHRALPSRRCLGQCFGRKLRESLLLRYIFTRTIIELFFSRLNEKKKKNINRIVDRREKKKCIFTKN